MSLQSYSQKGTIDSAIILPKKVAAQIYKDLIRYDKCKEETVIKDSIIFEYGKLVTLKDSTIALYKKKDELSTQQIKTAVALDSTRSLQITNLVKEVDKFKRQRNIVGGSGLVLILLVLIL